jgi:hypothetical protein
VGDESASECGQHVGTETEDARCGLAT